MESGRLSVGPCNRCVLHSITIYTVADIDVLYKGDGKLMIMTPTFDVLSEAPLDTTDFGAGGQPSPFPHPYLS